LCAPVPEVRVATILNSLAENVYQRWSVFLAPIGTDKLALFAVLTELGNITPENMETGLTLWPAYIISIMLPIEQK